MPEVNLLISLIHTSKNSMTRVLARQVCDVFVLHGRDAAIGFLRGFWYGTGVRNHRAVTEVAEVFGLSTPAHDLASWT